MNETLQQQAIRDFDKSIKANTAHITPARLLDYLGRPASEWIFKGHALGRRFQEWELVRAGCRVGTAHIPLPGSCSDNEFAAYLRVAVMRVAKAEGWPLLVTARLTLPEELQPKEAGNEPGSPE